MSMSNALLERAFAPDLPRHETVAVREVVVFGATGRIGRHVVDEAARRGWRVRAATRDPGTTAASRESGNGVIPWLVRLDDDASLESAIGDCDAVIDCLGPRRNELVEVANFATATRAILDAMRRARVERLVCLSGAAVRLEEDHLGPFDQLMRAFVGSAAPFVLAAKQTEFETIRRSDVAWTALRPPLVVDGPRSGRYVLDEGAPGLGAHISRADCAVALIDQVVETGWVCRAPFLWSPRRGDSSRTPA